MEKMNAVVYTEYGGPEVLRLMEVEKPYPKEDEVLIRVRAVSINYGDIIARKFKNIRLREFNMLLLFWIFARFSFGFMKPKKTILGNSFSGEIEKIGNKVKKFRMGDPVFGYTGEKMGAYAEFLCISENSILAAKPSKITFEEAAAVPYGALMALKLLRRANIQKGQSALIYGASGSIGSAAIQLARQYYGAKVTAVCSTEGMPYVKSLGADRVIDYTKEDFTKNGETFDLIFDVLGKGSFSRFKSSLKRHGVYFSVSFKMKKLLQMLFTSILGGKKVICALASCKTDDLILIKELIEQGKIISIIDKCFSLEYTKEAHRYVETGTKKGNVILRVNDH